MRRSRSAWPVILAAALLLSVLVGGLAWYNVATYREAETWVRHTYDVLAQADRVLSSVARAEAAARGFMITSDPSFRARFLRAGAEARESELRTRSLTVDNQRQQARVAELGPLLDQRLGALDQLMNLGSQQGVSAIPEAMRRTNGAALGDRLRGVLREIRLDEEELLRRRSAETDRRATRTVVVIGAGTAALFTLLSVGTVLRHGEQKRREAAERELLASETRYRRLVEDVTEYAILALDAAGLIRTWNNGAERMNGYGSDQALGQSLRLLYTPEDREARIPEKDLDTARRGGACRGEGWRMRADGSRFWVEATITALHDSDGSISGFSSITRDLTEAQKSYRELQDSEARYRSLSATLERRVAERTSELEFANSELATFAYSVSHDLRAPLRAVAGFGQVLLEDYPEGAVLDAEAIRLIHKMKAGTARMAQLIEDLLNLSRVSRASMESAAIDLTALASRVAEHLNADAPDRAVDWQIHAGLRACGDSKMLRIVLENLLSNAWKFTSARERPCIEVGMSNAAHEQAFFVRDNGAGFNPDYAGKLFQPFQRLHRESEFPGTGIGLATVARIIHRHGGRVWAEGRPGSGATFFFTLGDATCA